MNFHTFQPQQLPAMIRLLLSLVIILTAVSCQKETDLNQTPLPPGNNDSIYLDRMFVTENGDTIAEVSFDYDNLKRLVSMSESSVWGDFNEFEYSYHGNDTVPFFMQMLTNDATAVDTLRSYRFYNAEGKTTTDSSIMTFIDRGTGIPDVTTYLTRFFYAPSRIFSITDVTPSFIPPYQEKDTSVLDAQGNILQTNNWHTDNGTTILATTSSFTYDTNPHPFTYMSNYQMHQNIPHGETLYYDYFSVNNILRQEETVNGSPWMDQIKSYQYTTNGLPAKATINDIINGETIVFLYKYKAL